MYEIPTRPIMWNVEHPLNAVLMYVSMIVALIICGAGIWSRILLWRSGQPAPDYNVTSFRRSWALFRDAMLQRKVVRDQAAALGHTLLYLGTLVLLFTTTMVFIHHDLGIRIYQGDFYLLVTLLSDLFGLGTIIGCAALAHRRFLQRTERVHNRLADSFALSAIALLCVQGFLLEGLRIHATNDPWANYSPVGLLVAKFFWSLSPAATKVIHFVVWWFHTLTVFGVLAVLPYTKFFHIIASSINLFFDPRRRPQGALSFPGDIEKLIESGTDLTLGLGSIKDYSWKQRLELDACTSCGRCQEVCPAYGSGKPLSPKWLILDSRNHMLSLQQQGKLDPPPLPSAVNAVDRTLLAGFLNSSGLERTPEGNRYVDGGHFRSAQPLVQSAARLLGGSVDARMAGEVMDPEVFWSCTTCFACVEACPVGINHLDQIVENRRNMTLMQGEVPHEAQATLRALENRGNPFGAPADRIKWITDLDVPILKAGESVDYLYWVGCVSAYDPRKQKIARSLVTLMKAAGLNFAILGTAEGCSGDPARRLGEENLFQSLAKKNIELFRTVRFKTIVANCPHCFNTIKNEYPQFGNLGEGKEPEIIHHSVLLKRLVAEQKLPLREGAGAITFHDPCYLGRYNNEYDAPRETLQAVKGLKILEMDRSREKGMCCGAGGGHFWMDKKVGERINVQRTEQAVATGATTIATGCPFCLQMMEDGVKLTDRGDSHAVQDIAEVLVEHLASPAQVNS
jgi:Fe-S oxidoreductase/nitrate reductase gamma subunit